jgi:hypothetical protein
MPAFLHFVTRPVTAPPCFDRTGPAAVVVLVVAIVIENQGPETDYESEDSDDDVPRKEQDRLVTIA